MRNSEEEEGGVRERKRERKTRQMESHK